MSWAQQYKELLAKGITVTFRPMGRSMEGLINQGDLVTVEPYRPGRSGTPVVGAIVLVTVGGKDYLHLVKAINMEKMTFVIGNNKGGVNGEATLAEIRGMVTHVESEAK